MTDMRLQPTALSRRRLLGLLGGAGAASSAIGQTAAASETPTDQLSVDLFAFVENRCLSDACSEADYVIPAGTEADFGAYVTGTYDKTASVLVDQQSGAITFIEGCPSDTPVEPCREFSISFDEPGEYAVRYFAGRPDSGPIVPAEALGDENEQTETVDSDCETSDAVACDSLTIAVVDPAVDLTAEKLGDEGPIRSDDTLVVEAMLDPLLNADSWAVETDGVPTEDAAVPDVDLPPGVARWGKRALGPGPLELTATATLGNVNRSGTVEIPVESQTGVSVFESTLIVDNLTLSGQVELGNETDVERSGTVSLRARTGDTEIALEAREVTLGPGEETTAELSGTAPDDSETAVLVLDEELLARRSVGEPE